MDNSETARELFRVFHRLVHPATAACIPHRAPSIIEAILFINFPPGEAGGRLGMYIHIYISIYLYFNFTHHFVGE